MASGMSLTFGPAVRLRSSAEFAVVQKTGRRVAGRFLTLLGLPNALPCDRLGLIASRKLGTAVVRNRAKRRVRAIFRHQSPDDVAARGLRGFDFVVIPKRELADAPFDSIQTELVAAMHKLSGRGLR